jgi:signal transduction histidine kinase
VSEPVRPRPEELAAIEVLADLMAAELAWIAERSTVVALAPGEALLVEGSPADTLFLLLEGRIEGRRERGPADGRVFAVRAGEVSGMLPFSRMTTFTVTARAVVPSRVVRFPAALFPELLDRLPQLEPRLVGVLTDRVRETTRRDEQAEKLLALGKLSAGLAHELNNPAAATRRAAAELRERVGAMRHAAAELAARGLANEDRTVLCELADAVETARVSGAPAVPLSPLESADRESEMADWLEERGIEESWRLAPTFVDVGLAPADLDRLAARLPEPAWAAALVWLEAGLAVSALVADVESASRRISELVGAVKSYSHMDTAADKGPTDLAREIESTLTMLSFKVRKKGVVLARDYDPSLPPVEAYAGELNQVWTNLLDNALDAVPAGGHVTVATGRTPLWAVVEIRDDGPGIPPEIEGRIWEPFFTTKPVGEGSGLGLDIARRIVVQRHGGELGVESRPGDTRFIVRLPLAGGGAPESAAGVAAMSLEPQP